MIPREKEVFREHLRECIEHFEKRFDAKVPAGSKGTTTTRKPMCDFLGINDASVRRILQGGSVPTGETLIKLVFYLDLHGYRVIEFERLPKVVKNFAELIGFGILAGEEASTMLGYSYSWDFYTVFRGKKGVPSEKEESMYKIWKEHREELDRKKEKAFNLFRIDVLTDNDPDLEPKANQKMLELLTARKTHTFLIMQGLLGLLDEGVFDEISKEELSILRENSNSIVRLSAHLNSLSLRVTRAGE